MVPSITKIITCGLGIKFKSTQKSLKALMHSAILLPAEEERFTTPPWTRSPISLTETQNARRFNIQTIL